MRHRFWVIAWVVAASCQTSEPAGEAGAVGFKLTLPNGVSINSIDYEIRGPNDFQKAGSFSVSGTGKTFSASIDDLLVANDYTIEFEAERSDGLTACTGSAGFDIAADTATLVTVRLRCPGTPSGTGGTGGVMIEGDVNVCPLVEAARADADQDARTYALSAEGSDGDEWPGSLTYEWTASTGTIATADSAEALLTCPSAGGPVELTIVISDGDCSDREELVVTCAAASNSCVEDGSGTPSPPATSQAVAYQINPAHTGAQPDDTLRLPLQPRWSRDFGTSKISYPLAAEGRVFVTVGNLQSYGVGLFALNEETGNIEWGPVALGGSYWSAAATYENGRVFAVNGSGLMTAYNAQTGQQLWAKQMPNQYSFSSAPTAYKGRVYVGGAGVGGTLYAVDAESGDVSWMAGVTNGDHSSPAVSNTGVYVGYACNQAYGFTPKCGKSLWHYSGSCSGGGGKNVALIDEHVYTRDFDGDLILDAQSGDLTGTYGSDRIPASAQGKIYTVSDGKVWARAIGSAVVSWSFGTSLTIAPIVVGQHVVVGASDGTLTVLSASDGAVASSYTLTGSIAAPDEHNVSSPLVGLAAANNRLYVPNGNNLTAF